MRNEAAIILVLSNILPRVASWVQGIFGGYSYAQATRDELDHLVAQHHRSFAEVRSIEVWKLLLYSSYS